jgi:hypothetical protein
MCSTVGPRRTAVERFMSFAASPHARETLAESSGLVVAGSGRATGEQARAS